PRIDECDVLAGLRHVRAGIAADGAHAHYCDLVSHGFLPPFLPLQSRQLRRKGKGRARLSLMAAEQIVTPSAMDETRNFAGETPSKHDLLIVRWRRNPCSACGRSSA